MYIFTFKVYQKTLKLDFFSLLHCYIFKMIISLIYFLWHFYSSIQFITCIGYFHILDSSSNSLKIEILNNISYISLIPQMTQNTSNSFNDDGLVRVSVFASSALFSSSLPLNISLPYHFKWLPHTTHYCSFLYFTHSLLHPFSTHKNIFLALSLHKTMVV